MFEVNYVITQSDWDSADAGTRQAMVDDMAQANNQVPYGSWSLDDPSPPRMVDATTGTGAATNAGPSNIPSLWSDPQGWLDAQLKTLGGAAGNAASEGLGPQIQQTGQQLYGQAKQDLGGAATSASTMYLFAGFIVLALLMAMQQRGGGR